MISNQNKDKGDRIDRPKQFRKVIKFGFDTILLSEERIRFWEELHDSWISRDLERMKSNYINVKKELAYTLEDNKTIKEENDEYAFNIKLYKDSIKAVNGQNAKVMCDLINNNKMTVGKLNTYKIIKRFIKKAYKDNMEQLTENKGWLKCLKFIKEKLRVEIYEVEQELNQNTN